MRKDMSLAEVAGRRESNKKTCNKYAVRTKKTTGIIPVVFFVLTGFLLFVSKIMVLSH